MDEKDVAVLVEINERGWGDVADFGHHIEQSKHAIENALEVVRWVSEKARALLDEAHNQPDEVELEFGIKVGSEAGILVANTAVECHIKAKVIWKKTHLETEVKKG